MEKQKFLVWLRLNLNLLPVFLLWFVGFTFYFLTLTRFNLITGVDGAYYLLQVRSLIEDGKLVYGDPPLVFVLFSFFVLLVKDVTLGVKIGVSFFSTLSVFPIYLYTKKVTEKSFIGYIASTACIFSASYIRMMSDLMKNAVGIFFLLFFLYYLHRMVFDKEHKGKNLFLSLTFLILTELTHILDFGVALLLLILYFILALILVSEKNLILKNFLLIFLVLGAATTFLVLSFPELFTDFAKISVFLGKTIKIMGLDGEPNRFIFPKPLIWLIHPTILGITFVVGYCLALYEGLKRNWGTFQALLVISLVGTFLSLPFIPPDFRWRFMLMEFIPLSIILAVGISKIDDFLILEKVSRNWRKIVVLIVVLLCLTPLVFQSVEASKRVHPFIPGYGYQELVVIRKYLPDDSVVVAKGVLIYWVQYVDRCDAVKKFSPKLWEEYSHVFLLIEKTRIPPLPPNHQIIFKGKMFMLVKLFPPKFFSIFLEQGLQ